MTTKRFTIDRNGRVERTTVGRTGRTHVYEVASDARGEDGHFTDEGQYRRAIEQAVRENGGG